jgi:hypothetical protein
MTDDILDNTFAQEDKEILRKAIGTTLVSWASNSPYGTETEVSSLGHVLLDFGTFRLLPTIQDFEEASPLTEDVQRIGILTEARWKELLAKSTPECYLAWPQKKWYPRKVGRIVTGVTLYTDVKTDWYRHDDGHLQYTHDACGIAFHFGKEATLLLEKVAAFTLNWNVFLQYAPEATLVGEREPGALVLERL